MSLFPAYSEHTVIKTESQDHEWLANSSYPSTSSSVKQENEVQPVKSSAHEDATDKKTKRKRKKERIEILNKYRMTLQDNVENFKKKKTTPKTKSLSYNCQLLKDTVVFEQNEKYCISKNGNDPIVIKKTIPKRVRPKYKKLMYPGLFPIITKKVKLKKDSRYFRIDSNISHEVGTFENEIEASKKIEDFNKKLGDNPCDIDLWIQFVNFQDEFYKYQHIQYKSDAERDRAAGRHKLNILDRAVQLNPANKELQALWLKIGTNVLPSEEVSKRINEILEEYGGTMVLWLGLMTTTQYSLARCTVSSVSHLFEKLLMNFQNEKSDIYVRDRNVLEILFHYGRFLDNCGQWETLWTIIKVNLQFNTKIVLNFNNDVDGKVKILEDEIMKEEKRAVWQLWSQLERIREGLHFLPSTTSVDYPQRCVLPENVVNFTWHFHPDLHFQLVVSSLVQMKIPLLPTSHTIQKLLVPDALPWIYDSPEYLFSSLLSSPAVQLQSQYLKPLTHLSRGPQYLRRLHGQKEFLDLISFTFEACFKGLQGKQKTAIGGWWLRFERWIHLLNELKLASLPEDRKSAKKFFKDFLALDENRENLLYYTEYCLLQFNQGNIDASIKSLKTLIMARPPVLEIKETDERSPLAAVYKCLCEVLVAGNQKQEAVNLLINLGNGAILDTPVTIHGLLSAEKKYKEVILQLLEEFNSDIDYPMEDYMMPDFVTEWTSCYLWLIALTKTPIILRNTFNEIFSVLDSKNILKTEQIRECLWETILAITWTFERNNLLYVKDILQRSYSSFPQNLKILNYMAANSLEDSKLWLNIRKIFLSPPSTSSCIYLICVALDRYQRDKDNYRNRMRNILHDLALGEGKLSSIIHCLRLRYLFENEDVSLEKAQLQALESCPWCKNIYTESILLLPAKLMQLTDVLIEKELKIHITPDEIQEMRD
ncbi:hypothetical protein RUM43_011118 [Polyplax serrata]|uniref:Uncharacterized protein n=1 Tax=Polyplax serrata TaxID=468196 RepID=A0AAN8S0U5_POLSC